MAQRSKYKADARLLKRNDYMWPKAGIRSRRSHK